MTSDFYVEKFNEVYPTERVKNYLVFLEIKTGWVPFLQGFLLPVAGKQFLLFLTQDNKFICGEISSLGEFGNWRSFKHVGKNKVEIFKTDRYNGLYKLLRSFNTMTSDEKQIIKMLEQGDYTY